MVTVFHQRNMDHYRRVASGDFPVYGGISRRNATDSIGDSSVISSGPTVLPQIVREDIF